MSFDAKVFRILIASPGDVEEERSIIPEIIDEWNTINAVHTKVILMPIKWETHSAPMLGDRPQAIINKQIVKDCDLLVGIFWTRIGTNTGVSISGTVEEIEHFLKLEKPAMLYFSKAPVDPDEIDIDQFKVLKEFKEKIKLQGLIESYDTINDFKHKFSKQLSINIGNIINAALQNESSAINKRTTTKSNDKVDTQKAKIEEATINSAPVETEKLTDAQINDYLIKSISLLANREGWARIAAIGEYLQTYTPINYRELGFSKLQAFLKSKPELFEFKTEKSHPIIKLSKKNNPDSAYL